jgi:hypothetical protein
VQAAAAHPRHSLLGAMLVGCSADHVLTDLRLCVDAMQAELTLATTG